MNWICQALPANKAPSALGVFLQNAFFWYFPTQLLNIIAILTSESLVVNKAESL